MCIRLWEGSQLVERCIMRCGKDMPLIKSQLRMICWGPVLKRWNLWVVGGWCGCLENFGYRGRLANLVCSTFSVSTSCKLHSCRENLAIKRWVRLTCFRCWSRCCPEMWTVWISSAQGVPCICAGFLRFCCWLSFWRNFIFQKLLLSGCWRTSSLCRQVTLHGAVIEWAVVKSLQLHWIDKSATRVPECNRKS